MEAYEILSDRSIVELRGHDALTFLQKLTTNDLINNKYCYTYMLNNQGRYLFDFFVYQTNDQHLLIDINTNQLEQFIEKLISYKFRAQVDLSSNKEFNIVYSEVNPLIPTIYTMQDPRYNALGLRSLVKINQESFSRNNQLYLASKYKYTIIDGYNDLIYEKSIPIEYGAEEFNSIDYNKGCYVGQEIISRTKYQGTIRKKLYKINSNVNIDFLQKGSEITANDNVIGIGCSFYYNSGIALVKEDLYQKYKDNIIKINGITIELSIPHWRKI